MDSTVWNVTYTRAGGVLDVKLCTGVGVAFRATVLHFRGQCALRLLVFQASEAMRCTG